VQRVGMRVDCYAYIGGAWQLYWSRNLVDTPVQVGLHAVNDGAPGRMEARFRYFNAVAPFNVGPTPTPTAAPTPESAYYWQEEAEDGVLTAPMAIHADPAAFGGEYVSCANDNAGRAEFQFTVPETGDYWVWARAMGMSWTENSFFSAVDSRPDIHYEAPQFAGEWRFGWDQVRLVNEPVAPFRLAAGAHTLVFKGREAGTRLDVVLVTNDPAYVPGESEPTPTQTPRPPTAVLPLILH
jgi:hypothetical protein